MNKRIIENVWTSRSFCKSKILVTNDLL